RLGDLAVALAGGGQLGDASLAGREGIGPRRGERAQAFAGGGKFLVRPARDGQRAAVAGEVERAAQRLARVGAAVGPAQGGAEVSERAGVLEPGGRVLEQGDGLAEALEARVAAFEQA